MASDVKLRLPDSISIIGGIHVAVMPERTLREFDSFDYAVLGDGEYVLCDLIKFWETHDKKGIPENIDGLAYMKDNSYIIRGEKIEIPDINATPVPAWDMFSPAKVYILHTQRGCPYHCPFCINPNGRSIRKQSVDKVINEINFLCNFTHEIRSGGRLRLVFGDEIFTVDRERTVEFCNQLISTGLNKQIEWSCQTHINHIDYELARLMHEAACFRVGLGVESGNPERLKEFGKGTTPEKIMQVVKDVKKAKLPVEGYFILGYTNETEKSAMETINFAVKLNPTYPVFGIMVPYPGTKIGELALKNEGGYTNISSNWNDYNKQIGNAVDFSGVSRKKLEKLQLFGYLKVYICNFRFIDMFKTAWAWRKLAFSMLWKLLRRKEISRVFV